MKQRETLVTGIVIGAFILASLLLALIQYVPGNTVRFFDNWIFEVILVIWFLMVAFIGIQFWQMLHINDGDEDKRKKYQELMESKGFTFKDR